MPEAGTNPTIREDFTDDILEFSAFVLATVTV